MAALTAVVVGASTSGFWIYRKAQIRHQQSELRAHGMEAAKEGRNGEAADLLWAYLQRFPDDPEVLEKFAQTRLEWRNSAPARHPYCGCHPASIAENELAVPGMRLPAAITRLGAVQGVDTQVAKGSR